MGSIIDTGDFSDIQDDQFYISFVTLIELSVGYKTEEEKEITQLFIDKANRILINDTLITKTIEVRKNQGLKLPDSIIVATAMQEKAILVTSDKQIVKKGADLNIQILDPLAEE